MSLEMVRGLYDYHRWANRRLFDAVTAVGEGPAAADVGPQFSFPTLKGMLAHIYGADWVWLSRWRGTSPTRLPADADFPTLTALRQRWDPLEQEQRAFVERLTEADLRRPIEYTNTLGKTFRFLLWPLLQHVPNHATHHRSEIATMLTMVSGSPPSTDVPVYLQATSGRVG